MTEAPWRAGVSVGFRQKSRGIRFGPYEYVSLLLIGLTIIVGVGTWLESPRSNWLSAPAEVTAISLVENTRAIEASRPKIHIHFDYVVSGQRFRGQTRLGSVSRVFHSALPPEVMSLLRSKGYLSFKDLPPDIQKVLRSRGLSSFGQVPHHILEVLRVQGYNGVNEFPEDVERLLREGAYAQAGEKAGFSKKTIAALTAARPASGSRTNTFPKGGATAISGSHQPAESRLASIPSGSVLRVRYDPQDPSRHEVVRFPLLDWVMNLGFFLVLVVTTVFYSGVIYPRVKQR